MVRMKHGKKNSNISKQPTPSFKSKFVTVNSLNITKNLVSYEGRDDNTNDSCITPLNNLLEDIVWESNLIAEECCYQIIMQAQNLNQGFIIIFVDDDRIGEVSGILKILLPHVVTISLKSIRNNVTKILSTESKLILQNRQDCIIVVSIHMAGFLNSCLPSNAKISYFIHIGDTSDAEFNKRLALLSGRSIEKTQKEEAVVYTHYHVLKMGSIKSPNSVVRFEPIKEWRSLIQRRISTSRKIYRLLLGGKEMKQINNQNEVNVIKNVDEMEFQKGIAGKLNSLRSTLKVLLSLPLTSTSVKTLVDNTNIGIDNVDSNSHKNPSNMVNNLPGGETSINSTVMREKMEILGLISSSLILLSPNYTLAGFAGLTDEYGLAQLFFCSARNTPLACNGVAQISGTKQRI